MKLNMDSIMDEQMEMVNNMEMSENVTNVDNSNTVNTNTSFSSGGIVISNNSETVNETTNETTNDTEVENVQENEQTTEETTDAQTEEASGITDMLVLGAILVAIYFYNRKK